MWSRALEVTTNNFMAHYGLGSELGTLGRHQEAADHLKEALRINPEYTPAYYNLGVEFANLSRFDEAAAQFSEALRRDPSDSDARNNLEAVLQKQKGRKITQK
jgi:tetratricopeptide (TPR) repeat protein